MKPSIQTPRLHPYRSLQRAAGSCAAGLALCLMAGCVSAPKFALGRGEGGSLAAGSATNAVAAQGTPAKAGFDLGFLASRDTDLQGSRRLRVLGPFFERRDSGAGSDFLAFRPAYSLARDPAKDLQVQDYLWPWGTVRDLQGSRSWRFIPVWGHDADNRQPDSRYWFHLLPVLFVGRDGKGQKYFAIFPLAGSINGFLSQDRITFALFPLYAHSTFKDLDTHSILWPIVSRTTGADVSRFRVFPLYGRSEHRDRWIKQFILWPIWTSVHYDSPSLTGDGHMLFPLYGHAKVGNQEAWMFLPPFFRWSASGNSKQVYCPWPFVQYSSGIDEKFYLWPLWGQKTSGHSQSSSFFLWPLCGSDTVTRREYVLRRKRILPLFYCESREPREPDIKSAGPAEAEGGETRKDGAELGLDPVPATAAGDAANSGPTAAAAPDAGAEPLPLKYWKVWPVASYLREGSDARFRALDLWPLKRTPGIEKNLAPFWTLYSHATAGDATEQELLWGLYRRRTYGHETSWTSVFPLFSYGSSLAGEGSREWSFLKGLTGYRRQGARREYRFLYFLTIRR